MSLGKLSVCLQFIQSETVIIIIFLFCQYVWFITCSCKSFIKHQICKPLLLKMKEFNINSMAGTDTHTHTLTGPIFSESREFNILMYLPNGYREQDLYKRTEVINMRHFKSDIQIQNNEWMSKSPVST